MSSPSAQKVCFVIAPIGESGSDIRERSDKVLRHIIKPVVNSYGYKVIRADEISEPGSITAQVIQHLVEDALVIADLTGHNPNVFYELAVRHAVRKPYIHLIAFDEKIPFDIADQRAIKIDISGLDEAEKAREELSQQIEAIHANHNGVETPISQAINLQTLQQSNSPLDKTLASILLLQDRIARDVDNIQEYMASQIDDILTILKGRRRKTPKTLLCSVFYGVGAGVYTHGLGVTPDYVLFQTEDGTIDKPTFSSKNPSTIRVFCQDSTAFLGVAIKNMTIHYKQLPYMIGKDAEWYHEVEEQRKRMWGIARNNSPEHEEGGEP